jgi:ribose transport system substrate-binding protein
LKNILEEEKRMQRGMLVGAVLLIIAALPLYAAAPPSVGLSLSTLNNPFFVDLRDGAQAQTGKAKVTLLVLDAQDDAARQASQIEDLIQKKVAVIAINPTDSDAIVPVIKKINAAKIPVITVDRGANGGVVAAHIASDNVAGGRMAAKYVGDRLKGKGNVVMLEGIAGTSAARDRGKGFRDGLKQYPGIKLVAVQTADFDRAKGLTVMENILQAQKNIDAVFAQNDEMALGAIKAIEAAKRQKQIFVVGFDATADALTAVKEGSMAATVAQQPKVMGQLAVEAAGKLIRKQPVVKFTPVPLKLVTKATLK